MSKLILLIVIFLVFFFITTVIAKAATYANPLLVLDMRNKYELPRAFRTTSDQIKSSKPINLAGFANLHSIASGQFSKLGLDKVLTMVNVEVENIVVMDLRRECHGFLNGNAVSWYGIANADNKNLSIEEIEDKQTKLLLGLSQINAVTVYKILSKSTQGKITNAAPVDFAVRHVLSESEVVQDRGLQYRRIYVQDFHAPSSVEVNRFIGFVKELNKDQWIYFHCRAGKGRSTTFMAMYDMMQNAKNVSFNDIIARQVAIGGRDLSSLPSPKEFKYQAAKERLTFLKKFYQYARNNNDQFSTAWAK